VRPLKRECISAQGEWSEASEGDFKQSRKQRKHTEWESSASAADKKLSSEAECGASIAGNKG